MSDAYLKTLHITSHCGFVKEVLGREWTIEQLEYEVYVLRRDIYKLNKEYPLPSVVEIRYNLQLNLEYIENILAERILLDNLDK